MFWKQRKPAASADPTEVTMSLGEHLEELRWRLARALIALVLSCLICIWPAKYLLQLIARPAMLALQRHSQPTDFLSTSPVETLLMYIKVVVTAGVVLAAPYILYQLWAFVASGLYAHERRFVTRLLPWSIGLFFAGVAFMYVFVLAVSLNFLVGFNTWLPLPHPVPTTYERWILGEPAPGVPTTQPAWDEVATLPIFLADPPDAPVGKSWINVAERRWKVRTPDGVLSRQLDKDGARGLVATHWKIGDYLSFFLIMMIGFGVAFQTPLVVLFLVGSGIVPIETLRKYRKIVILIIVILAGILAPPDFFSHVLLSIPMVGLFELGLLLAARNAAAPPADRDGRPESHEAS